MKVAELEIGSLYQIKDRFDNRCIGLQVVGGRIDLYLAPNLADHLLDANAQPSSRFFVYLGRKKNQIGEHQRMVLWDGKILPVWGNSWQHVEKCS